MKQFLLALLILSLLIMPVSAAEITAPQAPDSAAQLMPEEPRSFGEGLMYILRELVPIIHPSLAEAAGVCMRLIAVVLLLSVVSAIGQDGSRITDLVGIITIGIMLIEPSNAFIGMAVETVKQMSDYGKLLMPVMTAAMAAQGGIHSSGALYAGTLLFDSILSSLISRLLTPMLYLFLALSVANAVCQEDVLNKLRDFVKWLATWMLKIVLYVFTGYMSITGVISGSADAAAVKAAKLTISGMVPVVGGILSDASETVLVSTGIVKNAAGIYGLLAVISLCAGPFLKIGVQYLLLKATVAVCSLVGTKQTTSLISDFSCVMGLLLAVTGTMCLLLLISTVCFMKGVG